MIAIPTEFCSLFIRLINLSLAVRTLELGIFTFLYTLFLSSLYRVQVHIKCCSFLFSILHSSHILSSSLQFIKQPVSILRGSIPHQIWANVDHMCFGVKFKTYIIDNSGLNSVLNLTYVCNLGSLFTSTSYLFISFSFKRLFKVNKTTCRLSQENTLLINRTEYSPDYRWPIYIIKILC